MGEYDESIIDNLDQDIINEVGNILTNRSANAFAKMIRDSINIKTEIKFVSIADFKMEFILTKDFSEIFKGVAERHFGGFFLKTSQGANGVCVILFNQENVEELIKLAARKMGADEMNKDEAFRHEILKEFSNITLQSYLSALSNLIKMRIESTMPIPAQDILGTLYEFKENLKKKDKDKALMMRTEIKAEGTGIQGKMIILLEPESLERIINTLKARTLGYGFEDGDV